MGNYYDDQLQPVLPDKGDKFGVRIKVSSHKGTSKWLNLNLECIESLQAFIDILKEDLEKEE